MSSHEVPSRRESLDQLALDEWWPLTSHDGWTDQFPFGLSNLLVSRANSVGTASSETDRHTRLSRRRGRAYTGCLTCRERKIKCDGRRPTCMKCERSRRYDCRGYLPPHPDTIAGPDEALSEQNSTTKTGGNRVQPITAQEETNSTNERARNVLQSYARNIQSLASSHILESSTNLDSTRSDEQNHTRESQWIEPYTAHDNTDVDCQGAAQICLQPGKKDDDLLIHYRDVVSHMMMPTIDAAQNPWLRIYFPMALIEPPPPAQLALRHALMSVAAYHLSQTVLQGRQNAVENALRHKTQAFNIISAHLGSLSTAQTATHKHAFLATAMTLISTDVFGLYRSDYNVHLSLAKRIVQATGGDVFWKSDALSTVLYRIFRCYETLAATTSYEPPELQDDADTNQPSDDDSESTPEPELTAGVSDTPATSTARIDNYINEKSFGISSSTMRHLRRVLRIANQISNTPVARSINHNLDQAITALEKELHSVECNPWAFDNENIHHFDSAQVFRPLGDTTTQFQHPSSHQSSLPPLINIELAQNHQWAFHYAVRLYFSRVIHSTHLSSDRASHIHSHNDANDTTTCIPVNTTNHLGCQNLVRKILDRLENFDCLTNSSDTRPANTLWPGFIAAVEATSVDLRQRALIWLHKTSRRGCGNANWAKELVMEVWRRVDRMTCSDNSNITCGLGAVDWRLVMKELGLAIMLT